MIFQKLMIYFLSELPFTVTVDSGSVPVAMKQNDTILDLKYYLEDSEGILIYYLFFYIFIFILKNVGIPVKFQSLQLNSTELTNRTSISDSGITKGVLYNYI